MAEVVVAETIFDSIVLRAQLFLGFSADKSTHEKCLGMFWTSYQTLFPHVPALSLQE